jgi:glyoxylase-like metal-dependent hydrolase (beta-lactamase superfamily II)
MMCVLRRAVLPLLTAAAVALLLWPARAQGPVVPPASTVRVTKVQGNVYLLAGAGGNVTVQAGEDGVFIVDTGAVGRSTELLAAIRAISSGPLRYIVNTSAQAEHRGGNAELRLAGRTFTGGNATAVAGVGVGAAIVAHEHTLRRLSGLVPTAAAWPTDTFYVARFDLHFNDEPVEVLYQPAAVTDGDVIVHFRRSDVISTGDVFRLDTYPVIDVSAGGSINGLLAALNRVIEMTIPRNLQEGGTMVIPGHGRVADESDVVHYRDMLTFIRDRIADMARQGQSLAAITAARPGRDYDGRYGSSTGPWTTDMFIEAVYQGVAPTR